MLLFQPCQSKLCLSPMEIENPESIYPTFGVKVLISFFIMFF